MNAINRRGQKVVCVVEPPGDVALGKNLLLDGHVVGIVTAIGCGPGEGFFGVTCSDGSETIISKRLLEPVGSPPMRSPAADEGK